jgi:D(-)-tartrate dehydratase
MHRPAERPRCLMRIVDIKHGVISLHSQIRNAYIDFSQMTASCVALITDVKRDGRQVIGYGFCSNGRYDQDGIITTRLIPRLLAANSTDLLDPAGDNFDPARVWTTMMRNEKPGGHGERSVAVGCLDMAVWDVVAKVASQPLFRIIADRRGSLPDSNVFVYAAGGYYYPAKDLDHLQDEVRGYLAAGYQVVKIKIGGATLDEDLRRVEAVLAVLPAGCRLAVDANGRFDFDTAHKYAAALGPYSLFWLEEPGDPLDYELNAEVCRTYNGPVATGENLFSLQDVRNLLLYAGLRSHQDYIQVDPALSYGLVEYLRIVDLLAQNRWSLRRCIPHGGHQFGLHLAAGLQLGGNESYPGVFEPIGGFADGQLVVDSHVTVAETIGIGIEEKATLYKVFRDMCRN